MEQAVNVFTKGLQIDTNPMVQGTDTLTDCLNGTLVTMLNNELSLQNDMGNRRVDNAYLPSGYLPVGMKEYGGIIYIAAYNPITNRSQIGSFPSPLKKLDNSDYSDLGEYFDFNRFFLSSNIENGDIKLENETCIKYLKSDSFLVPLTKNINLHSGDKFAIYSSGLSEMENKISNYNNIGESLNKAHTPKNRKYTIQAGILNSQNEFVDITKTLCRWDKNNKIKDYDDTYSEIYKFNDGYFISDDFKNVLGEETINDAALIRKRQKMAANTYSYKLIGPLYLKFSLNHIESFNYNIYGNYDGEKATLWVEGFLTYNCPDGGLEEFNPETSNYNENYEIFDEIKPTFRGFIFGGINEKVFEEIESNEPIVNKSVYNPHSNTYSVKIVKKFENIIPNPREGDSETLFRYGIYIPCSEDDNEKDVYIKGLSTEGIIDLGLLGSGTVSVLGWRFYNNVNTLNTTLTYSFDAYPEYGQIFNNLRFKFKNVVNDNIIWYPETNDPLLNNDDLPLYNGGLDFYNGRSTININGLFEPRALYKVEIYYDILENGKRINTIKIDEEERWFLYTGLFNEFYSPSKGINDFCTTDNESFTKKMIISLEANSEVINDTTSGDVVFNGSLISKNPPEETELSNSRDNHNIEYSSKVPYYINIKILSDISIHNEELYPNYVKVKNNNLKCIEIDHVMCLISDSKNLVEPEQINASGEFKKYLTVIEGELANRLISDFDTKTVVELSIEFSRDDNTGLNSIQGTLNCYNYYFGYGKNYLRDLNNVFDGLYSVLEKMWKNNLYCGISPNYDSRLGSPDGHYIDVFIKQEKDFITQTWPDDTLPENCKRIREGYADLEDNNNLIYEFEFDNTTADSLYSLFNEGTRKGQMFCFLFTFYNGDMGSTYLINGKPSVELINNLALPGNKYARVWWRTSNGNWALFKESLEKPDKKIDKENISSEEFINFLRKNLEHDYIYCVYDNYSVEESSSLKFYTSPDNYKYYERYNILITYYIYYKLSEGYNFEEVVELGDLIGNLKFTINLESAFSPLRTSFNYSSSEKFSDNIDRFDPTKISNIELTTGLMYDSEGVYLDQNHIYYFDMNKLYRLNKNNNPLRVDRDNKYNNLNSLVYNIEANPGFPKRKYDCVLGDDNDSTTYLNYETKGTIIVDGV